MAKAFQEAILVCSGGATGRKNLARKTEAGLMKAYLAENCGIAASRIHIDERARTTSDNAINTLDILKKCGIQTMTLVTSSYHQCRGQILYSLMAELYRQQYGYSVGIVGNYCYRIEASTKYYAIDDRIAIQQIASILKLPKDIIHSMPPLNIRSLHSQ